MSELTKKAALTMDEYAFGLIIIKGDGEVTYYPEGSIQIENHETSELLRQGYQVVSVEELIPIMVDQGVEIKPPPPISLNPAQDDEHASPFSLPGYTDMCLNAGNNLVQDVQAFLAKAKAHAN